MGGRAERGQGIGPQTLANAVVAYSPQSRQHAPLPLNPPLPAAKGHAYMQEPREATTGAFVISNTGTLRCYDDNPKGVGCSRVPASLRAGIPGIAAVSPGKSCAIPPSVRSHLTVAGLLRRAPCALRPPGSVG